MIKIEGLKELDAALGDMSKATARNVLYRVLNKAAKPLDEAWRANAPVLTGALKRSGGIQKAGAVDFNAAYSATLSAGGTSDEAVAAGREAQRNSDRSFAEIVVGPGKNPQAITQEFGTEHHPPQAFFRPAWEANESGILETIKTDLKAEIDKAAARAARKAAKLAAKG